MDTPSFPLEKPKKARSVRHTRAVARDRSKRPAVPPLDEQVSAQLTALIHPLTLSQVAHCHDLGLRERVASLPVLVLSRIWRQMGSVSQLVRQLHDEGFLWTSPTQVSQQAHSQRLRSFPPALFARVFADLLPQVPARWAAREQPLPPEVKWAQAHYAAVLAVNGSTPDVLLRMVGLLRQEDPAPLAGRMTSLWDVSSR